MISFISNPDTPDSLRIVFVEIKYIEKLNFIYYKNIKKLPQINIIVFIQNVTKVLDPLKFQIIR